MLRRNVAVPFMFTCEAAPLHADFAMQPRLRLPVDG
jgi:hypothetical protein